MRCKPTHAIEVCVERHGGDRRQKNPAVQYRSKDVRKLTKEMLRDDRDQRESHSGCGDHAEHDQARSAKNERRHGCDDRGQLRNQAENDQDDAAGRGRLMIERANLGSFAFELRVRLGREPAAHEMRFEVGLF